MSWEIGFDNRLNRDIGYGVPAYCDHPKCNAEIDRGISFVCGSEPYGGESGCGLYFCEDHREYHKFRGKERGVFVCSRCARHRMPFNAKPEHPEWIHFKMTDPSWEEWRKSEAKNAANKI